MPVHAYPEPLYQELVCWGQGEGGPYKTMHLFQFSLRFFRKSSSSVGSHLNSRFILLYAGGAAGTTRGGVSGSASLVNDFILPLPVLTLPRAHTSERDEGRPTNQDPGEQKTRLLQMLSQGNAAELAGVEL